MAISNLDSNILLSQEFIHFAIDTGVLDFGEFRTKAGRVSPYFFNAGKFYDGASLGKLAQFYARKLLDSHLQYDMIFGPAYKGITLASATSIALSEKGINVPFAFNRKESKDHGERGNLIGAPLTGRVVVIDDVISAGTSINESVEIIRSMSAIPVAVLIALNRMEKSGTAIEIGTFSAVEEITRQYHIPVLAITTLKDILQYLNDTQDSRLSSYLPAVQAYQDRYGCDDNEWAQFG